MKSELTTLYSLEGRSALVTGGTSGIGFMAARGLLLAGAVVYVVGRNEDNCKQQAQALSEYGNCHYLVADLSLEKGISDLIEQIKNEIPELSILVNNAGMTGHSPLGEYAASLIDDVFHLNFKTPLMLIQGLLPLLESNASAAKPSQIINTGSVAAMLTSTPDSWAYGPSKAGLHHLTKMLAKKLAPKNVQVNAIAPGLFPSKMSAWIVDDEEATKASLALIPANRLGESNDIASLIIYIASSRYLTGTVIPIDGGYSL